MSPGSRRGDSCSGLRRSCTQLSLHGYGLRAGTFQQSNSLRANSFRDGGDHMARARRECSCLFSGRSMQRVQSCVCLHGFTAMHCREETNADPLYSVLLFSESLLFCHRSNSPALASSAAFALMVVTPGIGLSSATLRKLSSLCLGTQHSAGISCP